jgi:hypothetical protein
MEILLEQYKKTRSEIELILKQINSIVAFTPIGCAEMLCETFGFFFYNSNTMSSGFRKEYEVFD